MANLSLKVTYLDGTNAEVKTRPATEVAFERHFDRTFADLFDGNARHEWVYFLAHHASKSAAPFEEWLETVNGIVFGGVASPDPSLAAPSTT